MSDSPARTKPIPGEERGGSRKKVIIAVALVAVVAAGVVLAMNRERLLVRSDGATPLAGTPTDVSGNRPPQIVALKVDSDRIEPFTISKIECEATDSDGDTLTYSWSANAGEVFGDGALIEWGSPNIEGLYQVSVTADDGRGGTADSSVSLRVKANVAPEILSLGADADWVAGGGSIRLSCEVADADGDDVSLEWTATAGKIYGQGNAVIWLAPDEDAVHWITVVARDSLGAEVQERLSISVTAAAPPEILEILVEGVMTDLLQERAGSWHLYKGRSCIITCVVAGENEALTYEWTTDTSTLVAEGSTATWTAPSSKVTATVMVTVSDQFGNKSSASVVFHVETCTCSF